MPRPSLENATGADIQPALQDYFTATTGFYQTQIDFANFIRRTTGHLDFGDVEGLSRQLQQSLNEGRTQAPALDSSSRYNAYQRLLQSRQEQENIDEYNRLADEQGGVRHGEGVPEPSIKDTVDPRTAVTSECFQSPDRGEPSDRDVHRNHQCTAADD